jgi:hypothetical protein
MRHIFASILIVSLLASSLFAQSGKIIAPDGHTEDYFGTSVAISGNTMVVGATGDELPPFALNTGGAYAYVSDGTQWTLQQFLLGTGFDGLEAFGTSVAIDGNVIVVGAPMDAIGTGPDRGTASVIERGGISWFETAQLAASDGGELLGERFGWSVAVSGDTIVVGAPLKDEPGNEDQGAAYVYVRSDNTWVEQAKLTASDGSAIDQFGRSVAISRNTIVVGAIFDDAPHTNQGSAYIFTRSGTSWTEKAKLVPSDGAAGMEFGEAVAISGGTVVVGAAGASLPGFTSAGAAYVYTNSGSAWPETQKLISTLPGAFNWFGSSVSVSSGLIVVGAEGGPAGGAHLFRRLRGRWMADGQLAAFDLSLGANFGSGVAVSAGKAVVGAQLDDIQSRTDQGSAFTWTGIPYRVLVDGRVLGPDGRGVANAIVSIYNDDVGLKYYAVTNPFGYYRLADIPATNSYTMSVKSKRFTYAPRVLTLTDDLANFDFTPQP